MDMQQKMYLHIKHSEGCLELIKKFNKTGLFWVHTFTSDTLHVSNTVSETACCVLHWHMFPYKVCKVSSKMQQSSPKTLTCTRERYDILFTMHLIHTFKFIQYAVTPTLSY